MPITLDMTNKRVEVSITEQNFHLETGILTLQISLGETYDFSGKVVTAMFLPTNVETAPLVVTEGVIDLPITAGLVSWGENRIQINIREGLTLEQSPVMLWYVAESMNATGIPSTDVDIVTYLIEQANLATAAAQAVVDSFEDDLGEGHLLQADLQQSIADGNLINDTLTLTTIPNAQSINSTLTDTTIPNAQLIDGTLTNTTIPNAQSINTTLTDTTIPNANSINNTLTNTTIPNANSINTTLTNTTIPNAQSINDTLSTPVTGTTALANAINTTLTNTTIPNAQSINTTLTDTTIPNAQSINTTLTDTTIPNANSINNTLTNTTIPNANAINTTLTNTTIPNAQAINTTLSVTTTPAAQAINTTLTNTTTPAAQAINTTLTNTTIPLAEDTKDALELAISNGSVDNINEKVGVLQNEVKVLENTVVQLNAQGDAKVTVTSYDTVTSLPKNAAQAGLGIVQSGMTATNLTDGDFSATGDWTSTFATFTVSNGVASFLANAKNQNAQQALTVIATHKYYVRAYVKTTTGTTDVAIRFNDGTTSTDTATASSAAWQKVSAIITAGASGTGYVGIIDKRAASWDTIQVEKFKTVNLTAIAQQSLTLPQSDSMLVDYFSGTASAVTGRIRSVGKNLFDKDEIVYNSAVSSINGVIQGSITRHRTKYFEVKPNQAYSRIMGTSADTHYISWFDENFVYLERTVTSTGAGAITDTSPALAVYGILSFGNTNLISVIQLELGSTATTYEPYKRTEQYCKPIPLRRLPNTALDDVTNGKHTQRVATPASVSGTMFANIDNATYTNVSVVKTTAFSLATAGTTAIDNSIIYRDKNGVVLSEAARADIDNLASVGKFYYHTDKTVWRILAKGSLGIATARTNLGTETIMYQLATPVITENVTSGSIIAYPSGTIYSEPVIADVAVYSTNAGILNTGYPISTLESIYKIDSVTGEQTPLAVASATVASGGLSFTHTGLVAGDLVFFTYYFAYPYPHGLLTYSYIDNTRVVLGADGKYYKIGFAVDIGGTITLTKTEVV